MKLQLATMVLCIISPVMSWKFKKYPYADLSFEEKVANDGYPLELYQTTTEDNYLLTIHRIPHGRKSRNVTNRSPVLLVHGMGGSPEMFVILGKYRSLAYNLADGGFDVWFLNARGSRKSLGHKHYNLNKDVKYWNFGLHEVAIYDLAANIDFIVDKTKQKVFLIGHSQGNTCYFILVSEKPGYNEKVKMAAVYAPSVKFYMDNPFITLFVYLLEFWQGLYDLLGFREMVPYMTTIAEMLKHLCKEQTYFIMLCFHAMSIAGSHPSKIMDKELVPVVAGTIHSRLSVLQPIHYMQIVRSGIFRQYDYGPEKNLRIYKNITPPLYSLKKATSPVAIFYGEKDDFGTVKGAEDTIKELPNVYYHLKVEYEHFNHLDFIFGKNASELVYQKTVNLFKDFDKTLTSRETVRNGKIKK